MPGHNRSHRFDSGRIIGSGIKNNVVAVGVIVAEAKNLFKGAGNNGYTGAIGAVDGGPNHIIAHTPSAGILGAPVRVTNGCVGISGIFGGAVGRYGLGQVKLFDGEGRLGIF